MKSIREQIEVFLRVSKVTAAQLARESGVNASHICRLRKKKQMSVNSDRADALRAAMVKLDPETAVKAL